ncbi:MAG: hypothetical protein PVG07_00125 [Acidobacteriota bacterium]|jgi:hypothetical protein
MKIRNKFSFGNTSQQRRKGVSRYLILASDRALMCSPVDFGVPMDGGVREASRQNWIFKQKWSKCDGYIKKSFHQKKDENGEGQALDLVPYIVGEGLCYDALGRFGVIGMLMLEAWQELQEEGKVPKHLYLHWGGLWKKKKNKSLGWDLAHFEIREYEQTEQV